jgi:hypothetical protein
MTKFRYSGGVGIERQDVTFDCVIEGVPSLSSFVVDVCLITFLAATFGPEECTYRLACK